MRLGANSVLFGGYDMETAFKHIAMAGYDGIELAAIDGMSQHLILDRWQELADEIKQLAKTYELDLLAMEQPSRDAEKMRKPFKRRSKSVSQLSIVVLVVRATTKTLGRK